MGKTYDLLVRARGETKDAERAMTQLQAHVRKSGEAMKSTGAMMTRGLTLPILAAGAASVKLASDADETASKMKVTFGASVPQVTKSLDAFAKATGASRFELREQATTIGALLKPMNLGAKATADMSVKVAKLATDLSSFNNVPVGEALASLRSGLTGETEPLKKFGILMNEASVSAEAVRSGIVKAAQGGPQLVRAQIAVEEATKKATEASKKHGAQSLEARKASNAVALAQERLAKASKGASVQLTDQEKVQARYSLIVKQTADAQGDAARTSGSFANQSRAVVNALKDTGVSIGTILIPQVQAMIGPVQSATRWFGDLSEGQQRVAIGTGLTVAALGPMISVLGSVTTAGAAMAPMLIRIGTGVGTLALSIGTAVPALSSLSIAIAANPLLAGIVAVGAIIAVGVAVAGFGLANRKAGDDTAYAKRMIEEYQGALDQLSGAMIGTRQADQTVEQSRGRLTASTRALRKAEDEYGRGTPQYNAALGSKRDAQMQLDDALNRQAKSHRDSAKAVEDVGRKTRAAADAFRSSQSKVESLTSRMDSLRSELKRSGTEGYQAKRAYERLADELDAAGDKSTIAKGKLASLARQFPELVRAAGGMTPELQKIKQAIDELPREVKIRVHFERTGQMPAGYDQGGVHVPAGTKKTQSAGVASMGWGRMGADGRRYGLARSVAGGFGGTGIDSNGAFVGKVGPTAAGVGQYVAASSGSPFTVKTGADGKSSVETNRAALDYLKYRKAKDQARIKALLKKRAGLLKRLPGLAKAKANAAKAVRNATKKTAAAAQKKLTSAQQAYANVQGEIDDAEQEIMSLGQQVQSDTEAMVAPDVSEGNENIEAQAAHDAENLRRTALNLPSIEEEVQLAAINAIRAQNGLPPVSNVSEIGQAPASSATPSLVQGSNYQPLLPTSASASAAVGDAAMRAMTGSGNVFNISSGDPEAVARRVAFILGSSRLRAGGSM